MKTRHHQQMRNACTAIFCTNLRGQPGIIPQRHCRQHSSFFLGETAPDSVRHLLTKF
ncbi:hypothetical protein EVA_16391 [gut metagenome]|uniref:Uncharacterized protein n=1 Tax=gut metagenome TaxID=749906 RepID=J9G111_9ZZZZ